MTTDVRRVFEALDRDLCSGDEIERQRIVDLVADMLPWAEDENGIVDRLDDMAEALYEAQEDAREAQDREEKAATLLWKAHAVLEAQEAHQGLVAEIEAFL